VIHTSPRIVGRAATAGWDRTLIGRVSVSIRTDGFISLYTVESDRSKTQLTLQTDDTLAFRGVEIPMQDYETIPREFRYALENAFPNLVICTPDVEEFEPYDAASRVAAHIADFQQDLATPDDPSWIQVVDSMKVPEWGIQALDLAVVPPSCPNPKFPVDARAMHTYMQIGKDFSNWIKDRIGKFQFVDNVDYGVFAKSGENPQGGRPSKEYWLTSTTARMMAADVNSARGVEVIKFLVARHERLEALEKVGQPAAIDFSDPVTVCKLYIEAEEGRRQGLALITTVTAEKVQAIACRDEAPMDG
jgi:phage anti-repressor protein